MMFMACICEVYSLLQRNVEKQPHQRSVSLIYNDVGLKRFIYLCDGLNKAQQSLVDNCLHCSFRQPTRKALELLKFPVHL